MCSKFSLDLFGVLQFRKINGCECKLVLVFSNHVGWVQIDKAILLEGLSVCR